MSTVNEKGHEEVFLNGDNPIGEKGSLEPPQAEYTGHIKPQMRPQHDSTVPYEEFLHYAAITRAFEDTLPVDDGMRKNFMKLMPNRFAKMPINSARGPMAAEEEVPVGTITTDGAARSEIARAAEVYAIHPNQRNHVSDHEWNQAGRAARLASASSCFFLITTDILGVSGNSFAIACNGWGPGIILFLVLGALAAYSGWMLYKIFLSVDSYEFPVRSIGDLSYRIYGPTFSKFTNFLQSVQLLCLTGVIFLYNAGSLQQITKLHLCFAVCSLIMVLISFCLGQIRTLNKYQWLANCSVWLNIILIFLCMAGVAKYPPNYAAADGSAGAVIDRPDLITPDPVTGVYPPVTHSSGLPNPSYFSGAIIGMMQAVYAYGGAMIFIEFMAELRRPRDFVKYMWAAQTFITTVYICFGSYGYAFQGQYVQATVYFGISNYAIQTAGNVFAILTGTIACSLYGNIGIKVFYSNVFVDIFHLPSLATKRGKILWAIIVPFYYGAAYIIASVVPNFAVMTALVGAVCIVPFTYIIPPLLYIGHISHLGSIATNAVAFSPTTGETGRQDHGVKRFIRGYFSTTRVAAANVFNTIVVLGALATIGLGAYSSIEEIIGAFAAGKETSFSCSSVLG